MRPWHIRWHINCLRKILTLGIQKYGNRQKRQHPFPGQTAGRYHPSSSVSSPFLLPSPSLSCVQTGHGGTMSDWWNGQERRLTNGHKRDRTNKGKTTKKRHQKGTKEASKIVPRRIGGGPWAARLACAGRAFASSAAGQCGGRKIEAKKKHTT